MSENDELKVMVVDDTVVYRRILSDVVQTLGGAVLLGSAPHGRLALAKLEQEPADLVLLDLEMPEMDGLETLDNLRKRFPETGVIMISGTNRSSADITVKALERGAIDFVRKPEGRDPESSRLELVESLKPVFQMFRIRRRACRSAFSPRAVVPDVLPTGPVREKRARVPRIDVIALGVSTGGPNALAEVIPKLPANLRVPVLLVQHMPPVFTASLAEHLGKRSHVAVREAQDGDSVVPGCVYIAPGGRHMVVRRNGTNGMIVGLNDSPPENSCRPAVDVLFRSVAAHYGGNVLAVIMTGMGADGREGVRALKRKGAYCLTQTADTCVVYGMPQAVDEAGLSDENVPLSRLAERIVQVSAGGRFA